MIEVSYESADKHGRGQSHDHARNEFLERRIGQIIADGLKAAAVSAPHVLPTLHLVDGSEVIKDDRGHKTQVWHKPTGSLSEVRLADGEVWTRQGYTQHWTERSGRQFQGKVSEGKDGIHFVDTDGVTRSIDYFGHEKVEQPKLKFNNFMPIAQGVIVKADTNGDGILSQSEINKAITHGHMRGEEVQLLLGMKNNFDELANFANERFDDDGISIEDLNQFKDAILDRGDAFETWQRMRALGGAVRYVEGNGSGNLFGDSNDPRKSIVPEAINQGQNGDCYFLAALASLARQNPEAIRNMIHDNEDGTYTVRFPAHPNEPITVAAPTNAEMDYFAHNSKFGTWPCILEKAYGQWRQNGRNPGGTGTPQEGADGGSATSAGLAMLTGRYAQQISTGERRLEDMDRDLTKHFLLKHEPMTALTGEGRTFQTDGVTDHHEWSITGYDPVRKLVTIRNPWGHGEPGSYQPGGARDGKDDGTFTMSLQEFQKHFDGYAYPDVDGF